MSKMSQSPLPLCQKCPFVSPLACQKCTNKVLYYVFFVPIKTPDLLVLNGFLALSGCFLSFNAFFPYFLRIFSLHPIFCGIYFPIFHRTTGKNQLFMSKKSRKYVGKVLITCQKCTRTMSEKSRQHVANVLFICRKCPLCMSQTSQ